MIGAIMRQIYIIAGILIILTLANLALNIIQVVDLGGRLPLALPPGAHDVHRLGNGWHTFRLPIEGRERLFLRRVCPVSANTESISEIVDSRE